MEPNAGTARLDEPSPGAYRPGGSPFQGPGLLARVGPFAAVAVIAEASLALPPGAHMGTAVVLSLVLLAVTALAFLLPWDRLPGWLPVLVPLAYTGSALALTLAAGTVSGVGIVILIPLIWTSLFHRRWESACVVVAIVAVEIVVSEVQSAPGAVTARRVLLWAVLGVLLAVATHGLRDRISQSQREAARLQERLAELKVIEDRDRLAADLQGSVIQRVFAVGLKLEGLLPMVTGAEARRRLESSVTDLDDAIRLLRQAVFGLENRLESPGLRQQVLQLCAGLSPVPEISFAGPVDSALHPEAGDELLGMMRMALGLVGTHASQTSIDVHAGEVLTVVITGTGNGSRSVDDGEAGQDFSSLHEQAGLAGTAVQVGSVSGGIRLAWSLPLRPSPPGRA